MSNITKREFAELVVDGSNYLTWVLDVEIYLDSCDLSNTIVLASQSTSAQKEKALIFLRHHLNKDLKNEYLTEKETELIEKTLSTFHASNLILQQQYSTKNYSKHSELISALLVAKKHNQLLMRNHNARPVGSQAVPEAHTANQSNTHGRGHGRGRRRGRRSYRGGRGRGRHNANGLQDRGKCQSKDTSPSHKPNSHQQVANNKQA
ncbi:uncharacterized protein LOC109842213 [Asparagus officinalis]|uniref:uncharacterized protein LOC109842213 n=1 Tax=Asparagus officinalis TaxID=4686 RepID=UPI00098E52B4|nr:uncharacterized protein LOC109842213 [Asparagus officinalis]